MLAYRKANRDWLREQARILLAKFPERKRRGDAKYRETHKAELAVKKKAEHLANRESRLAKMRERHKANPQEAIDRVSEWRKANPEAVFNQYATRRARMGGSANVEPVLRQAIYDRDKGICGICGEFVERKAMTLDHLVPISRGGEHTADNLQTAHRVCNCRKHARTMDELLAS